MTYRIRVIDIETTGLDPATAGICEVGWQDVIKTRPERLEWEIDPDPAMGGSLFVNPGHPIPPEISAIHHITDDNVSIALPWEIAARVVFSPEIMAACTGFAAHNTRFERAFIPDRITGGKPWFCTYRAALRVWPDAPGHSNQTLRYWLNPAGLNRGMASPPHRAFPDAYVTAHLLRDMLNSSVTGRTIAAWSSEPALLIKCQIGQHRGKPWAEVDSGFLEWMLDKDFDEDAKFTARHWLAKRAKPVANGG